MRYSMDDMLKNAYKSVDKEKPSNSLNQETISRMRELNNMGKRTVGFKLNKVAKFATICCCILAVAGVSTVAYSKISEYWHANVQFSNGDNVQLAEDISFRDLPEDLLALNDGRKSFPWSDIEEMLGFSLLGAGNVNDGTASYSTFLNDDGSIAVVDLWIPLYKVYDEEILSTSDEYSEYISLDIGILNYGADEGYILPFMEGRDAAGEMTFVEKYVPDNLNVEVIIYTSTVRDFNAVFVYDSVYYTLHGTNVTVEQMKEAIEGMK